MDRPAPFRAPMVRAILDGRKTQTRRVLSRLTKFGPVTEFGPSDTRGYDWHFRDRGMRWHDLRDDRLREVLPYAVGDRLWVREAWSHTGQGVWSVFASQIASGHPVYRATETADTGCKWWPSIHMPRRFSRLTLLVTDVRVQRLQGISEKDAEAEGCLQARLDRVDRDGRRHFTVEGTEIDQPTARRAFADLWGSINGPDAWSTNPWVVAVTFEPVRANIATLTEEPRHG